MTNTGVNIPDCVCSCVCSFRNTSWTIPLIQHLFRSVVIIILLALQLFRLQALGGRIHDLQGCMASIRYAWTGPANWKTYSVSRVQF